MIGGFEARPLPVDPRTEPPGFDTDSVPLDLGVLRQMTRDRWPARSRWLGRRWWPSTGAGMFTMSPDGRFLAGPVPEVPGLWVASGCNGSGFSSSPAIGEVLAGWIATGQPGRACRPWRRRRFGPLADEVLVERGVWQYAHYYDPAGAV